MVVSSWQAEEDDDDDPDSEAAIAPGLTLGINTHADGATTSFLGASYTGICTVFEAVLVGEGTLADREKFTVVHEIGQIGRASCRERV